MSDTPRTDALCKRLGAGSVPISSALAELARDIEREAHQTRMDAITDSKRLIDDKMKMFERITELERELSAIRARTVEECARVCEATKPKSLHQHTVGPWEHCAKAIRALASPPVEPRMSELVMPAED